MSDTTPQIERTAVIETVRLIVQPGEVTEVRALEAMTRQQKYAATLTGYFNDPERLADAVVSIERAKGIYFVPNPVDPALFARAVNRLKRAAKGDSTQDTHITSRRWLLVDIDPQRPSGISATDDEHEAALERAKDVFCYLSDLDWPDPIQADTGNGSLLLYRVELPVNDGGLIQQCLMGLAQQFDDEAVIVDTAMHNPARLVRLFGTVNAKGDSTADRPHRLARIVKHPPELLVVPVDKLQDLAANAAADRQPAATGNTAGFDLEAFIQRHGLDAEGPAPWNGQLGAGRRWEFRTSPMCEHHDRAAFLLEHAGGAISAGCHHKSCSWEWHDLRSKYEPGSRNQSAALRVADLPNPTTLPVGFPPIESFDELDLPGFPTDALPDVLGLWVEEESHATQTPPDLAGLLALAVCSATIAKRVEVEARPGYLEPVNLFVAVLLGPGNRKSAVFTDATRPLGELEDELIEVARPRVARAESERRQSEARLRKLEKAAGEKGDAEDRQEAGNLAEELAEQAELVLPSLIVDDATAEVLGKILAEQGGRIASMSSEGGVFDLMAGKYGKSGNPDFDVYLKGHAGDDIRTDRISRKSVRVDRPALTCAYAMQPQVIDGLAKHPAFRGRGLLARFLYAAPQSLIGLREIAPTPVSDEARQSYHKTVRSLAALAGEHVLQLSGDASAAFQEWEAEIESMLADGGRMELVRDWGAKLAGATLRLAAVLHCVKHGRPAGHIDRATIAAAIKIARSLVPHAEAVLSKMQAQESPVDADARYVLRWIERHGLRELTKRDAQQHGKRRFPRADDIDQALAELVRRGYIRRRPLESTGPGRPGSPVYEVNPEALAIENPEKRSHNSQNSLEHPENGDSENTENALEQSENGNRVQVTL